MGKGNKETGNDQALPVFLKVVGTQSGKNVPEESIGTSCPKSLNDLLGSGRVQFMLDAWGWEESQNKV